MSSELSRPAVEDLPTHRLTEHKTQLRFEISKICIRFQKPMSLLDILDTLEDFTGKMHVSRMLKRGHPGKFGHLRRPGDLSKNPLILSHKFPGASVLFNLIILFFLV